MDNQLYKCGYSLLLLKCLTPKYGDNVRREIYEGICGNHFEERALAYKAMRQEYIWPTMQQDTLELAKK